MRLSAPIYRLKQKARQLAREKHMPHHAALDIMAREEGFRSWSHLASQMAASGPAGAIYRQLAPGDLLLAAARPGQGKTLFSLELAIEAMKADCSAYFFSLEDTERDVATRFRALGTDMANFSGRFAFDGSDDISADYIVETLADIESSSLVVIDYLQLLDQNREKPGVDEQVRVLSAFARAKSLVIVFISQVDRSFDPASGSLPDLKDIRLPNPVDLTRFSKACFLHAGEMRLVSAA